MSISFDKTPEYYKNIFPKSKYFYDETGNIIKIELNLRKSIITDIFIERNKKYIKITPRGRDEMAMFSSLKIEPSQGEKTVLPDDIDKNIENIKKCIIASIRNQEEFLSYHLTYSEADLLIYVDNLIHGMKAKLAK